MKSGPQVRAHGTCIATLRQDKTLPAWMMHSPDSEQGTSQRRSQLGSAAPHRRLLWPLGTGEPDSARPEALRERTLGEPFVSPMSRVLLPPRGYFPRTRPLSGVRRPLSLRAL